MEEIQSWLQSLFILTIFQSTDLRKKPTLTFPQHEVMVMRLPMLITVDLEKVENDPDIT